MAFPTSPQPGSSMNNIKSITFNIRSSMINNKMVWTVCSLFAVVLIAFICFLVFAVVRISLPMTASFFYALLVVLGIFVLVLGIFVLWLVCSPFLNISTDQWKDIINHVPGMPKRFSAQDLESATKNFCERLGGGGFGSVFAGVLDSGTKVAVKRLDQNSGQGTKEFLSEVMTIGSIHHFNLVKLVGFCAENSHKLLVYEFMSNGSLDKWIFSQNQEFSLDWSTRSKIILHIAKGLSYLHQECSPRIIHLDLKPQNVLLDGTFNAKLSDFGLARSIDRDESTVQTTVRGTRGYMAPEFFTNRGISEKVDVYSFGIVVLEILCGRKNFGPVQPQPKEDDESILSLLDKVRKMTEVDQLFDVVDKQNGDMLQNKEAAIKMIKLAIACSRTDSRRRPSMSMVVKVLEDDLDFEDSVAESLTNPRELRLEVNAPSSASARLLEEVLSGPR